MTLGVIAARGGSKGLPGKNLRPLRGQPLIVHTIRAAHEARRLDAVTVSTDDPAIAEVARAVGAEVHLRPAELATDTAPIWPAVRDAVTDWERRTGGSADPVVLLQPTSPLRLAADIDGCVDALYAVDADVCMSVCRPHDSPYFNMVEPHGASGFVRPCSALIRASVRRQDAPVVYAVNGAVYAVRRRRLDSLENQFTVERLAVYEMPRERSADIDTLEDLELAEWWLERRAALSG